MWTYHMCLSTCRSSVYLFLSPSCSLSLSLARFPSSSIIMKTTRCECGYIVYTSYTTTNIHDISLTIIIYNYLLSRFSSFMSWTCIKVKHTNVESHISTDLKKRAHSTNAYAMLNSKLLIYISDEKKAHLTKRLGVPNTSKHLN